MAQEGQSEALLSSAKALLKRLDGGGELGVGELERVAAFADEVDEVYSEEGIEGVWWEVELQPLKVLVRRLPSGQWVVTACGDGDTWRRAGELIVGEGSAVAVNHSADPLTEGQVVAGAGAARELAVALGLAGSGGEAERHSCIVFWFVGSRTEVLKCVGADRDLYLVVAPHVVYSVRVGLAREVAVVRGGDAVRAIHVMLNTPY